MYADDAVYVGKGGFGRAIVSAVAHQRDVKAIIWATVQNDSLAFVAEYLMQRVRKLNKNTSKSLNIIWSPGKKYSIHYLVIQKYNGKQL